MGDTLKRKPNLLTRIHCYIYKLTHVKSAKGHFLEKYCFDVINHTEVFNQAYEDIINELATRLSLSRDEAAEEMYNFLRILADEEN